MSSALLPPGLSPLLLPAPRSAGAGASAAVKEEGPRLASVEYDVRPGAEVMASNPQAAPPPATHPGARELGVVGHFQDAVSWLEISRDAALAAGPAACRYVTASASGEVIPLDRWVPAPLQKQLRAIVGRALMEPGAVGHRLAPEPLRETLRHAYALRSAQGRAYVSWLLPPADRRRRKGYVRLTVRLPAGVALPRAVTLRSTPAPSRLARSTGAPDVLVMPRVPAGTRGFAWEVQRSLPPSVAQALTRAPALHPQVTRSLQTTQTMEEALHRLTPTERALGIAVVQGMSGAELARRAGVSSETIAGVLGRVFCKLGVRDRLEMGRLLIAAGVAHPGTPPGGALNDWRHAAVRKLNAGETASHLAQAHALSVGMFRYHLKRLQVAWGARSQEHLQFMALAQEALPAPSRLPRRGLEGLSAVEMQALEGLALGRPGPATKTSEVRSALDRLGLDEPWQAAALVMRAGRYGSGQRDFTRELRSLSAVDRHLVRLLVAGRGRGAMAAELRLGPQVLEERLGLLCEGLRCQNLLQLTCGALRAGILPEGESSPEALPGSTVPPPPNTWSDVLWRLNRAERQLTDAASHGGTAVAARRRLGWSAAHFSDVLTQLRYKLGLPSFEALVQQTASAAPLPPLQRGKLEPREQQLLEQLAAGESIVTGDEARYGALKQLLRKVECSEPYQLVAWGLESGHLSVPSVTDVERARESAAALPPMARDLFRSMARGEPLEAVAMRWQLSTRELRAHLFPARFGEPEPTLTGWLHRMGLRTEAQIPVLVRALGADAFSLGASTPGQAGGEEAIGAVLVR